MTDDPFVAPGGTLDQWIGRELPYYDDDEIVERNLRAVVRFWGDGRRARARLAERVAEVRKRAGLPSAVRRRRGRPKGSRTVPRDVIVETFRRLARSYGRSPTQTELAENLPTRIEVRTLQEHLTDYKLPWPIE